MARPLVLGEDPGLAASLADPWGMVLTFLWLLAATGWAARRFWLRPTAQDSVLRGQGSEKAIAPVSSLTPDPCPLTPEHWYGGWVQTALLATVVLVFVSAELAASYKFPARLIAWEWFGLFVSFFVMRQLAVTQAEQHGLFTVVLAGAVALVAQGIYQECIELPQNRQLAGNLEELRAKWIEENPGQPIDESFLQQLRQRALENNIFGPYAHPNSYAGFLILCLPGLVGAVAVSRRVHAAPWQTILIILCAVLGLAALWLTHSRGGILGLAAASAGVGLFVYGRWLRAHVVAVLIGAIVFVGLVYGGWRSGVLTTGMGKSSNTVTQRLEYWRTTWQMIQERPWLGVGPGNFGENYPRLMPASSEEKIKDPHNFALEMWATCGIFALLTLLAVLTAFFFQVLSGLRRSASAVALAPRVETLGGLTHPRSPEDQAVRWEFYLGGMFGLLLGFVLRVNTSTAGNILAETFSAAVRSVVWFAAFALLERLVWTERGRVLALTTGIVALLLNWCVSGGIGFPSVAGPFWVVVALALNAAALQPVSWLSRPGAAMILPLPIFLGLMLGYGMYILYPVLASDGLMRESAQAIAAFQSEKSKPRAEQYPALRDNPSGFIERAVIDRLKQAAALTPDDARIYVQLAWQTHQVWESKQQQTSRELPLAKSALEFAGKATQLDPHGATGYLVQYHIRMRYAELNEDSARKLREKHGDPDLIAKRDRTAREQYELAAKNLDEFLPNDPHDTALHFMLWRAWHKAGDNEKASAHAVRALKLDNLVKAPARKLTNGQRQQLEAALKSQQQ